MSFLPATILPQDRLSLSTAKCIKQIRLQSSFGLSQYSFSTGRYCFYVPEKLSISPSIFHDGIRQSLHCSAAQSNSGTASNSEIDPDSKSKPQRKGHPKKPMGSQTEMKDSSELSPIKVPRKPRRGRRSEAVAVEDFVRNSLGKTFASVREQNPDAFVKAEQILKEANDKSLSDVSDDDDDEDDSQRDKEMVVEEDDPDWPMDADVGWGIRASEYFEKYPIKNVIGDDGVEIDWEGELDDSWVQEINCLEWESFAFHPSPLIVFVFERYNRATDNWKLLKEMEKALKVYWNAKDRLPPRAVKLDINIERDLAYALKVRECPQILFLRGQRILYREREPRTADELVHMIAYFYYNAKKPSWIDEAALAF
uniref:Thioredoxin domain-containing protein n=1 Tax=Opuntia streptacantha TaxID=393608 RepID=A0A7C9CJC8_OPUST